VLNRYSRFQDLAESISAAATKPDIGQMAGGMANAGASFVKSRTIPGVSGDVAAAIDPYQREIGTGAFEQAKASIPGVRQSLPIKIDQLTGEPMKAENAISTMLFGRRVTTDKYNPVLAELNRLKNEGFAPAINDITKSSDYIKAMKDKYGDPEFLSRVLQAYGSEYYNRIIKEIDTRSYQDLTDDKKMSRLNGIRTKLIDEYTKEYDMETFVGEQRKTELKKKLSK
jgi:hypothetical protein